MTVSLSSTGFLRAVAALGSAAPASPAPALWRPARDETPASSRRPDLWRFEPSESAVAVDPSTYDYVIVAFSGGKDSLALLLLLLEIGFPPERIELWHHDVDGQEGSVLMDWPCTRAYCLAVAQAVGVPIYYSWKIGGYERELLKWNAPTAGYLFETPSGLQSGGGKHKKLGRRRQFPQKAADLSVRWCSAYVKIMVMDVAIRNQDRFIGRRTLVLTGERAEESSARANYEVFERHRTDLRDGQQPRWVDHWRPVHAWPERRVWALIEKYRVNPHPAYRLGPWGRVSCAACIFGSPNQWAALRVVNRPQFD